MHCFICEKHQALEKFTGPFIFEDAGIKLSHFPILNSALATRGHLLIETTRHICDMSEMNADEASALGRLIAAGTELMKTRLGAEHVYLFRINDQVSHLHFHLVPRYPNTPKEYWGLKIWENPVSPQINLEEIKKICAQLSSAKAL